MARRVKAGRKRSKNYCVEISTCVLLITVLLLIVLFYLWKNTSHSVEKACDDNSSAPIDAVYQKDGSYRDKSGLVYPMGYYMWVNGTLRGCTCALKPCIRKCCTASQAVSELDPEHHCVQNNVSSPFKPLVKDVYIMKNTVLMEADLPSDHFYMLYGDVCSNGKYVLTPDVFPSDINYLMTDGTIYIAEKYITTGQYCLDSFVGDTEIVTFVCFPAGQDEITKATFKLYSAGMFISLPFLLLTFFVYCFLSELQNLHGKSLMCYVFTLFFGYLLLGIIQVSGDRLDQDFCIIFAFIIQFSFLASFFWLNIMCFDIWWVFSGLRPLRGSPSEREHKKFIIYSIYAWGCPVIIFIITLIMQTVQSIPDTYTKPEFGVDKCWFKSNMATFLYFYLPIIILVVLNIIMFITTAFRLRAHTKETEVLKSGESNRHDENERQRFNLYLKLFIVMGVNWVMELISWLAGGPKSLWYVTDVTNTLQGVLIFLIFVWKPRILRLLNQKLCPSLQLVPASTSSTRSKVSPSRTTSSSLKQTSSNNTHPEPDRIGLKKMTSDESDAPA